MGTTNNYVLGREKMKYNQYGSIPLVLTKSIKNRHFTMPTCISLGKTKKVLFVLTQSRVRSIWQSCRCVAPSRCSSIIATPTLEVSMSVGKGGGIAGIYTLLKKFGEALQPYSPTQKKMYI